MSEENKVSEGVSALATALKDKMKVDKTTGIGEPAENLYKDTLPEGLDIKTVEQVKAHDRNFIAAGAQVFGELGVEAMASNKKLTSAEINIQMSKHDNVSYHLERHRQYQNHLSGDGATVEKYGILTTTYEVKGGKNAGDLKKVRLGLQDLASKKLAGK